MHIPPEDWKVWYESALVRSRASPGLAQPLPDPSRTLLRTSRPSNGRQDVPGTGKDITSLDIKDVIGAVTSATDAVKGVTGVGTAITGVDVKVVTRTGTAVIGAVKGDTGVGTAFTGVVVKDITTDGAAVTSTVKGVIGPGKTEAVTVIPAVTPATAAESEPSSTPKTN